MKPSLNSLRDHAREDVVRWDGQVTNRPASLVKSMDVAAWQKRRWWGDQSKFSPQQACRQIGKIQREQRVLRSMSCTTRSTILLETQLRDQHTINDVDNTVETCIAIHNVRHSQ
jgi:hypothetical protein